MIVLNRLRYGKAVFVTGSRSQNDRRLGNQLAPCEVEWLYDLSFQGVPTSSGALNEANANLYSTWLRTVGFWDLSIHSDSSWNNEIFRTCMPSSNERGLKKNFNYTKEG